MVLKKRKNDGKIVFQEKSASNMEDELKIGETDVRERTWELLRSAKRANRSKSEEVTEEKL